MASAELDAFTYPHKTAEYSYRVPTPPRIVVPPPALNSQALPEITLNALRSANFLSAVNYHNLVSQNAVLEWTYERRREAQMILPYLYLGPMPVCKDEAFLKGEKNHVQLAATTPNDPTTLPASDPSITLLLGIRHQSLSLPSKLMTNALHRTTHLLQIEHHLIDLTSPHDLIAIFPRTTALITAHLAHHYATTGRIGKVLVFCESGNERSAAVVAAYLMEVHADVDFIKAMQLVQAQRFCVNFDDGIKRLLQGYWDILCARRQVERVAEGGSRTGMMEEGRASGEERSTGCKRGLERDEDEEMEGVAGDDDWERFGGRTFAPFVDLPME
ncbi:hypothetical protein KC332_g14862 [Hortaea werneckii]|nr:hypothetical protein KC350_g15473 [Hortaea werneckii]KAI6803483.1 hypothetical protein KC358_g14902 [Hortaea werneckii]KAI6905781.1 hypothetical protein KC348_g14887 [Hortaea werneckii]KAI6926559.1 hypothetical protein KC341_g12708 [Hortaea werneckii]KAI6960339.1 hypothetical protein KC321_g12906 [Hortaea werneckii]